jgi:hypothetical protein
MQEWCRKWFCSKTLNSIFEATQEWFLNPHAVISMLAMHGHAALRRTVVLLEMVLSSRRSLGLRCAVPVCIVTLHTVDIARRNPLLAGPGLNACVRVHHIDGFEGERPSLEEEEVDDTRRDEVASEEHKTKGISDALRRVWSKETDEEVACFIVSSANIS